MLLLELHNFKKVGAITTKSNTCTNLLFVAWNLVIKFRKDQPTNMQAIAPKTKCLQMKMVTVPYTLQFFCGHIRNDYSHKRVQVSVNVHLDSF